MVSDLLSEPIARVYTVISVLVVIFLAVIGFTNASIKDLSNRSDDITKLTHDALLAAKTARPFPYTSKMHSVNELKRAEELASLVMTERLITKAVIAKEVSLLQKTISELPRPPAAVNARLLEIESSIHSIERKMGQISGLLSQLGDGNVRSK